MPLLNFKAEFADAVASGKKRMSIRKPRVHEIVVGSKLYLYTGLRSSKVRKLGEATCKYIEEIIITNDEIRIDGERFDCIEELIKADGFSSVEEFRAFFNKIYGLPFKGQIIKWELDK